MGQYFKYGLRDASEGFEPFEGIKMMEHSYFGTVSVNLLYTLIAGGEMSKVISKLLPDDKKVIGSWSKKEVGHIGDYSDIKIKNENGEDVSLYSEIPENSASYYLSKTALSKVDSVDFFDSIIKEIDGSLLAGNGNGSAGVYFINHSKKQYINLLAFYFNEIDPVSLLLVQTDSGGGGDYSSDYFSNMVGYWGFDSVSLDVLIPDDCKDITDDFIFVEFFDDNNSFVEEFLIKKSKLNAYIKKLGYYKGNSAYIDEIRSPIKKLLIPNELCV